MLQQNRASGVSRTPMFPSGSATVCRGIMSVSPQPIEDDVGAPRFSPRASFVHFARSARGDGIWRRSTDLPPSAEACFFASLTTAGHQLVRRLVPGPCSRTDSSCRSLVLAPSGEDGAVDRTLPVGRPPADPCRGPSLLACVRLLPHAVLAHSGREFSPIPSRAEIGLPRSPVTASCTGQPRRS